MTSESSRFSEVTRRAFMKGTLAAGFLAVGPLVACGNDDKQALATPTTTGDATPGGSPATAAAAGTTGASTGGTTTAASSTAPPGAAGTSAAGRATFPTGGQVVIDFTYAASSGGPRVNNPFIAVWIEDGAGALVRTVSLWFKRSESKYLQELQRWYSVDQGGSTDNAIDTLSSATRLPGTASVMWDGTDVSGARVALGNYFVCIEAAREHGPYELVRGPITIAGAATDAALTPNGEITSASAKFVV